MKTKLLTAFCTLALIISTASKTHGWGGTPPVADLSVDPYVCVGSSVTFNACLSQDPDACPCTGCPLKTCQVCAVIELRNGIRTYCWNFGDGSPVYCEDPGDAIAYHTYTSAGPYTVTLTVWDHDLCVGLGSDKWDTCTRFVTAVKVDKVVEQGTSNEGPIGICPGNTVNLQAVPYPAGASFPWGEPHWTIVEKSWGTNAYLYYSWGPTNTVAGLNNFQEYVVVRARCGDFDTGDTITVTTQLENEIPWGCYSPTWGTWPTSCMLICDGEDSYELDDCGNELEFSCCEPDGSGGTNCAYRVFYNNTLLSSCVFGYSPENEVYRKIATIVGTDLKVITKIKHINTETNKAGGGCTGYYCAKFYTYDCVTGASSTIWQRNQDHPPINESDGDNGCPGH